MQNKARAESCKELCEGSAQGLYSCRGQARRCVRHVGLGYGPANVEPSFGLPPPCHASAEKERAPAEVHAFVNNSLSRKRRRQKTPSGGMKVPTETQYHANPPHPLRILAKCCCGRFGRASPDTLY